MNVNFFGGEYGNKKSSGEKGWYQNGDNPKEVRDTKRGLCANN